MPPFWDYLREYDELRDGILHAVDRVFRSGQLILGKEGVAFENQMASYVGVGGGVGVNNGTDALVIGLAALGVGSGDEVITVPNTAIPTVSAIRTLGARPVFVDVRNDDFLIDVAQVEGAITSRTKAVIPVHLYGQCADLDPLVTIGKKHDIKVLEDCAQAQGSHYRGRHCGSLGDAGTFSFYPTKILGGYGDGGMLVSDSAEVITLAKSLRFYGTEKAYYAERHGYNTRLDEVQAAILALKLTRIETWIDRRRNIADMYNKGLSGSGLKLPQENSYGRHVYHLYVVETSEDRDDLLTRLEAKGLKCGIHYRWPIHLMRGFQDLGYRDGQFPITEKKAQSIFSLPMFPHMRDDEVGDVIETIKASV